MSSVTEATERRKEKEGMMGRGGEQKEK